MWIVTKNLRKVGKPFKTRPAAIKESRRRNRLYMNHVHAVERAR